MLLEFLTEDAYDKLYNSISENTDNYVKDEDWLPAFFNGNNYSVKSSVDVDDFIPICYDFNNTDYATRGGNTDELKSQEDLVNTIEIFKNFKVLTPLQASNKYMWTCLCHGRYRKYVRHRWFQSRSLETIKSRYFVTSGISLFDNALSRLWWFAYLTYDPDNSDHFYYTKILLTNQTICTDVIDTNNRMNPERMRGVLLAIKGFKDMFPNEGIKEYFRECRKQLNQDGACSILESFTKEKIRDRALNYMIDLRKKRLRELKNRNYKLS